MSGEGEDLTEFFVVPSQAHEGVDTQTPKFRVGRARQTAHELCDVEKVNIREKETGSQLNTLEKQACNKKDTDSPPPPFPSPFMSPS